MIGSAKCAGSIVSRQLRCGFLLAMIAVAVVIGIVIQHNWLVGIDVPF